MLDLHFTALQPFLLVMVFVSLALLGVGFFLKSRQKHLVRIAGWALFGLYWPFQAASYFWPTHSDPDPINGWFTLLGPLFIWWIAHHEWRSYKWGEDPAALRWFTGASFVSAATYFVIYKLPAVTQWLTYSTAKQSAWLYNWAFFGGAERATVVLTRFDAELGILEPDILLAGEGYAVTVVLACTAIQSIMIFVGAIACLSAERRRKWLGYLYTVPTIYFLNLFRNAGIVYGYKDLGWGMFGIDSFEWMHSYVGKIGSLLAMVVIALAVFKTLPELHNHILDLFDLRKRHAAGFFDPKPPRPPPTGDEQERVISPAGGAADA